MNLTEVDRLIRTIVSWRDYSIAGARAHAAQCVDVCRAQGIPHDAETLSHNIEGNYPDLTMDECDAIAEAALR